MVTAIENERDVDRRDSTAPALTWAGGLLVGGLVVTLVATLFHPGGQEDNHEVIFAKYADSDAWVAVHLAQFLGVLATLAGLLALYDLFRRSGSPSLLARLAAGATVATAAVWALLQGLDGVGLKQAVDAWQTGPQADRQSHFASAETIRWLEWGFQSYFRLLLGIAFVLLGATLLSGRLVPRWLAFTAVLTGVLSLWFGIDVGYNGLASGTQDFLGLAFLAVGFVFGIGLLAAGIRGHNRGQTT